MTGHATQETQDPDRWFVNSRPKPGAEFRLFMFPFAGGGPSSFTALIEELPDNIESRTAHYPGRGSRFNEPAVTDIALLAGHLSESIRTLTGMPFAFFGHSMGALVAFELARLLQRMGLSQPVMLIVSGCSAPQYRSRRQPIHALPDDEFLQAVIDMHGTPVELMKQPDALQLLTPMLRADFEAIETHRYDPLQPPLDCPILALGGLADPNVDRAELEGWTRHTRSRFEAKYFRGDHFFIFNQQKPVTTCISREILSIIAGSHA